MMSKIEIGSEFDSEANQFVTNHTDNKISDGIYTRSGRDALFLVANDLLKQKIYTVLIPSLCCSSMVQAFYSLGFDIVFYDIAADVQSTVYRYSIDNNIAVLINSYFGVLSTNISILKKVEHKTQNRISTILDFTHSYLKYQYSHPFLGQFDYCVASIRKWMYLPSGGFLYSQRTIDLPGIVNQHFSDLRREALEYKTAYLKKPNELQKKSFRSLLERAEAQVGSLKSMDEVCGIDMESQQIIRHIDFKKISSIRKANASYLANTLHKKNHVDTLFSEALIEDNPPLYFPILVNDRDIVQKRLSDDFMIYCPVIWPIPREAQGVSKKADYISSHMLALPCDQRYSIVDMEYIHASINRVLQA